MTEHNPTALDMAHLGAALTRLTDTELTVLVARMYKIAERFRDDGSQRVADLFASLTVLGAEEQDRRRDLAEHARRELEGGDDIGALLSEWADMPDLDDL